MVTLSTLCSGFGHSYTHNYTQGLDLDVSNVFEMFSQSVSISSTNQYLLSVGWLEPVTSPIGKSFEITVNSTSFANVTVTTNNYVEKKN